MLTAGDLHLRGLTASNAGRHTQAKHLFERALHRATDPETRARCLLSAAHVAAEQGNQAEGLALCAQALAHIPARDQLAGLVHSQIGLLYMRTGDERRALEAFAEAHPLLLAEPSALARLHLNQGNIHLQRQRAAEAIDEFRLARDLAVDPVEAAKAEHNLAYAEYLRGNLVEALRLMQQADVVLDPLSPFMRAVNESDRAEVLSACGLPDQAATALEHAAHAFALRKLRQSQAEAELIRARILLGRDPVMARNIARRAARRFRLRGSEDWALRAEVVAVGAEVAQKRRTAGKAAADLHGALAERQIRAEAKTTCLYAAAAALDQGDTALAAHWLRRGKVNAEDPLDVRLLDRLTRARLAGAQGRRLRAFDHLRGGLDELHEWLSSYGSLDLQSALVGRGRGLAAYGLELAVADGRPHVVFEWFERARVLVSRVSAVRPPTDDEAASDLAALRQQDDGEDADALRERIRQRSWYTPTIGRSAHPVELVELQAALNHDALVSFVRTESQLTALVVTDTATEVVPLRLPSAVLGLLPALNADLDMAASELPPSIAAVVRSSLGDRLATIDEKLISPVAHLLVGRRVVIVPAGALAGVPWALLPGVRGQPVTVARSATHWVAERSRDCSMATAGFITGPGVPRAPEEVRRAALGWGDGTHRVAIDGNADVVNEVAATVDVLHVAAHGRHSADNPLFSGIELTGGPWFGYDIDQLPQVPSVVLLSACELGRSSVRGAEELVGMTTAWLHAGTRCVIASPVAVNDNLAGELLPLVHQRLAAGVPPAEALAAAMTEVEGLAAFACYGSGW